MQRAALLVGFLMVAGCAGESKAPVLSSTEPPPLVPPEADYGALEGFVYDAEVKPIGNTTVEVVGENRSTATDEAGYYALVPMDAGAHQLLVNVSGYIPLYRNVTVLPGTATRLDFALRIIPDPEPYIDTGYTRRGQIQCQARASAQTTNTNPSCSDVAPQYTGTYLPPSYGANLTMLPNVGGLLIEVTWQSAALTNEKLRLSIRPNEIDSWRQYESSSPLRFTMGPAELGAFGTFAGRNFTQEGGAIFFNLYPGETTNQSGVGAGVTFQQDYTMYVTVFYRQPPIEGFTRLPPT